MKKKLFLFLITINFLSATSLLAGVREDIIPLSFIGPKVVLANINFKKNDVRVSKYRIAPETIDQVMQVLESSVALLKKLEMPDKNVLRKITLYWNVNTSGTYHLDEKKIEIFEPWGEIITKNCEDVNEEIIRTDKQRLGVVAHEFAHAIFHQNIKKEKIDAKKYWILMNGYNEMFADATSVLVLNDLEIAKGCQNSRSFKRNNESDLMSEEYNYRGQPSYMHIVFDPARLVFGDLIKKNSLSSQSLIKVLFNSIVRSLKREISLKEKLPYIERNNLFIKNLKEEFEFFAKIEN